MVEIDWNVEATRVLCHLFAEQVARGNRPNTYLNPVGYAEVEKGLKDRLGIAATKQQIKNKWDKLKEEFKAWRKLMLRQTGTGWCPVKGTIVMDDEWWKKARADIPGCGKFRKMGLQNEEQLQKCFGDITSIGMDHWSPHMANVTVTVEQPITEEEEINNETQHEANGCESIDVPGCETDEVEELPPPSNANGKRPRRISQDKMKKTKTGTAQLIQEAMSSVGTSASVYAAKKDGKFSIDEVMEHVLACGATYETNEYYIAMELFVKKEWREMFMILPTTELRFKWLTRKYNDKYGN